jgi:hypothetical protein
LLSPSALQNSRLLLTQDIMDDLSLRIAQILVTKLLPWNSDQSQRSQDVRIEIRTFVRNVNVMDTLQIIADHQKTRNLMILAPQPKEEFNPVEPT